MVSVASAMLLILVIGQMILYNKEIENEGVQSRSEYLERTIISLERWYISNAILLDNINCPVMDEQTIFEQASIIQRYGVRVAIGSCISAGAELSYRNIAVWIPSRTREDTSSFNEHGIFVPADSQVEYRVVSGMEIQGTLVNDTRNTMLELARLLEVRFQAKIDGDPLRDLQYNYFRALDCANPGLNEIPCTSFINASGYVALENNIFESLRLSELASISQRMTIDAWGQPIEFNNVVNDPGNICVPSGNPNRPPYTMLLRANTPWGTHIVVCPTQPVN